MWNGNSIERLRQDLRLAARVMLRRPLFTVSAVLLLALAIGVNTTLFSIVDAVWFRPLPFPDPNHIVAVWERPPRNVQWKRQTLPFRDFLDLQRNNHSFKTLAAATSRKYIVAVGDQPESVTGEAVTAEYLSMLGVPALQGRTFLPADHPGSLQVVLSYGFGSRVFGGRNVIGQALTINSKSYTILGVMPSTFAFPSLDEGTPELWTLLSSTDQDTRVSVVGRIRPSVSKKAAESEAAALLRELHDRVPLAARPQGMLVRDLEADRAEFTTPILAALSVAAGLVLLIACANVAGLLLGRASERRQEMAIRYSLGAARSRIVRQLLTENVALWMLAGAAGVLLSIAAINVLRPLASQVLPELPQFNPIAVDSRAAIYALLVTFVTGVLFGLLPALQASRLDIVGVLKEGGRGLMSSRRMHYWRKALIASEVGFCVVLLIGAGLLLKSLVHLTAQPLGFRAGNDVTFKVELTSENYQKPVTRSAFYDRLLEQIGHLPGVESVGATSALPLNGTVVFGFSILGLPASASNFMPAGFEAISSEYFRTIGMPVFAGRNFNAGDSERADHVAIVNRTLARRYFADEDPIGKRIKPGDGTSHAAWMTIVGVVGDVKHAGLDWDYLPEIYLPYRQLDEPAYQGLAPAMYFVIRGRGRLPVNNEIRSAVWSLDRNVPVVDMMGMNEIMATKELPSQSNAAIFAAFAGMALLLAAVGLYAIVSQSVLQRRKEIGIRIALGASAPNVIGNTIREGIVLAATGAVIGLAGGALLTQLLRSMLFGVATTDPSVFVAVPLLLLLVAIFASLIPALRAASADPLEALRCD
jgi:putative ABC transport system permease protein